MLGIVCKQHLLCQPYSYLIINSSKIELQNSPEFPKHTSAITIYYSREYRVQISCETPTKTWSQPNSEPLVTFDVPACNNCYNNIMYYNRALLKRCRGCCPPRILDFAEKAVMFGAGVLFIPWLVLKFKIFFRSWGREPCYYTFAHTKLNS